ncbi:GtrA family protein [Pandoraea cepalis]|uniref:Bactoprenol-linked glucose translocase (GtrA) n=1 Tax=Pandoraea cepalis TaxID=2508294 RepID=A0A5E4XQL4_9BURK|nr:GtrA family protein [Pandoraea cepalis]VVE38606.1 bactoprenol-linked glucose translocase (gtrA) [Pandoraea cepalis]
MASRTQGRFVRFGVSGVASTGVHVAAATTLLATTPVGPTFANAAAFCIATICSYLLNTLWSFSSRIDHANVVRFALVSLVGLSMTTAIAHAVAAMGGAAWLGIATVVATVPPVTYLMHRHWTYR